MNPDTVDFKNLTEGQIEEIFQLCRKAEEYDRLLLLFYLLEKIYKNPAILERVVYFIETNDIN